MSRFAGWFVLLAALPVVPSPRMALLDSLATADSSYATAPAPLAFTSVTLLGGPDAKPELLDPTGVTVDAFGHVYLTDAATHRVLRLERDGRIASESGSLGTDPSQMRRPSGVALLGTLGTAVLDRDNVRVLTFDLFGRPLGTLIDLASDDLERRLGRVDAVAIASDRGGALALLDRERDRVLLFDFAGRFVRELGGYGTAPGSFRGLRALAFTPRGELVTADRGNARVQRFDAGGQVAASWPVAVTADAAGLALAVDGAGRVALADEARGTLELWDAHGSPLGRAGGLGRPRALAFAPDGTLIVVEGAPVLVRRLRFEPPASTKTER